MERKEVSILIWARNGETGAGYHHQGCALDDAALDLQEMSVTRFPSALCGVSVLSRATLSGRQGEKHSSVTFHPHQRLVLNESQQLQCPLLTLN